MSRRTAESNKAIFVAWNKEQELVQEGKGTREWTPEQQQDILEKGKAYDDDGVAFQGQHMKSAEMYPEYQGDPGNIQFLTRVEHLEAHNGNWRNPTNWYFNPITKEKRDFGDGPFIPCEIIRLPAPIASVSDEDSSIREKIIEEKVESNKTESNVEGLKDTHKKTDITIPPKTPVPPKMSNMFVKGLKSTGRFIVEHPIESLEIVGVVIGSAAKVISSIRGQDSNGVNGTTLRTSSSATNTVSIADKVADIVEKTNRTLLSENDVTGHKQRYHTNNGVIWKDKAPYHRGGKENNSPSYYSLEAVGCFSLSFYIDFTLIFAVFHWLSELVRYNPKLFNKYMKSKQNWLIHEFINNALDQFVDEIGCEITCEDIMCTGYRK